MRRLFQGLLIAVVFAFAAPDGAHAGPSRDLIEKLAADATPVLNDRGLESGERASRIRAILGGVMDREAMAPAIIGRYWRRATPEQRSDLTDLLEAYLVHSYASRMDSIEGQVAFEIGGERPIGARTMVDTRVIRPSAPPVAVSWQVESVGGQPKVTDIVIEGVSMVVSQRDDFSSVIRQQGGIDGLIGLLRQRVGG